MSLLAFIKTIIRNNIHKHYNKKTIKKMKKIIYVLTLFFVLTIPFNAVAQDLMKSKDLSTIKVDYLSDDDLAKISAQLKSNNTSIDQVEQIALSKGMTQADFNKLKIKLKDYENKNGKRR